jgi:hypothetical protein
MGGAAPQPKIWCRAPMQHSRFEFCANWRGWLLPIKKAEWKRSRYLVAVVSERAVTRDPRRTFWSGAPACPRSAHSETVIIDPRRKSCGGAPAFPRSPHSETSSRSGKLPRLEPRSIGDRVSRELADAARTEADNITAVLPPAEEDISLEKRLPAFEPESKNHQKGSQKGVSKSQSTCGDNKMAPPTFTFFSSAGVKWRRKTWRWKHLENRHVSLVSNMSDATRSERRN